MVSKLLRRVFGGGGTPKDEAAQAPAIAAREDYQGFELRAMPIKEGNLWRVAGSIVRNVGGTEKTHEFVRADTFPDHDAAVGISMNKARLIVDQLGERMFDQEDSD